LIFGAGLGLRYFTPVGPLRVDVAVPLDRRDVDDAFQFYVSLGQAF
jgi:translocation and assembly module TamA